jgi:uncharacterized protein (DUF2141 family)
MNQIEMQLLDSLLLWIIILFLNVINPKFNLKNITMKNLLLLLLISSLIGTLAGQDLTQASKVETGTLLVMVQGFKNTDGQLMVGLYNTAGDYINKDPYKGSKTAISANQELIKFENIPYGDYAIAVIHDMNMDGKLDKNAIGIPTEGYGFSNDAMGKYGPPTFLEASFVFAGRDEEKIINLEYGIPKKPVQ